MNITTTDQNDRNDQTTKAPDGYAIEPEDLIILTACRTRLNSGEPMDFDQRRALACVLDTIVTHARDVPVFN